MVDELSGQRRLIANITSHGGWARKWATSYSIGVPDLVVVAPFSTFFTEVKLEKDWNLNTQRTIAVSPIQKSTMDKIAEASGRCCITLLTAQASHDLLLALFPVPKVGGHLLVKRDEMLARSHPLKPTLNVLEIYERFFKEMET